jgi:V8-like Glu-specific endopeptidase
MSNLRDLLAGLYGDKEDARSLIQDAGLNPAFISISNKARNTWHSIIEEADKQRMVGNIIARARKDYPRNTSLALAEQNLLLAVETPPLGEDVWRGPKDSGALEKIIGVMSTLRPISFLERGLEKARSVARVVLADGSCGSGFLTGENLLITNNHVIPSEAAARGATVQFNYQKNALGLDAPIDAYELEPEKGFATSPEEEQGGDDWTAVRVKGNPKDKWGFLPLSRAFPKVDDEVAIIQHPGGGQKQIAMSHNIVVFADERRLQYLTDTLEGSSGSPVFNADWQVVAIHHKGGALRDPGSKRLVYRNQGVHINIVIDGLSRARLKTSLPSGESAG